MYNEGIKHELYYRNTSQKNIVAIQFGFVSFDVWNEFLNKGAGLTIENLNSNEKDDDSWITNPYGSNTFFTGVTYTAKVRFDDGQFWNSNLDDITK